MALAEVLFVGNLLVVGFLTGVIWFVQIVHYPLFAQITPAGFGTYHTRHSDLTTRVVALPMVVDFGLSGLLIVIRPEWFSAGGSLAGFALALLTWLCTFLVSVPLHGRLGQGHDRAVIARLVATNWLRTATWTAHLLLLAFILLRALP